MHSIGQTPITSKRVGADQPKHRTISDGFDTDRASLLIRGLTNELYSLWIMSPRCPRTAINSQRWSLAATREHEASGGFEPASNAREHARNA